MDYLEIIAEYKRREIQETLRAMNNNADHALHAIIEERKSTDLFSRALKEDGLAVIGEVKRRSPSVGSMAEIEDPLALALKYSAGGAAAISVLTDFPSFGGSLNDLERVSLGLSIPTLRKDFIMHSVQLAEAAMAGAAAVLLIVRLVKKELKGLLDEAKRLGLETLTEIHSREDLAIALEAGASIIGINHRNLKTFEMDFSIAEQLLPLIPSEVIKVGESRIHTPADAKQMRDFGYDAILVGEALVRTKNPAALIAEMKGARYEG